VFIEEIPRDKIYSIKVYKEGISQLQNWNMENKDFESRRPIGECEKEMVKTQCLF
jgi:hypothetical protein